MCLVFPLAVSWLLASFCLVLRFPAASRDFRGGGGGGGGGGDDDNGVDHDADRGSGRDGGDGGDGDDGDGINFGLVLHSFGFDFRSFWVHLGSILVPFWIHFGCIWAPFWVHFGIRGGSLEGPRF